MGQEPDILVNPQTRTPRRLPKAPSAPPPGARAQPASHPSAKEALLSTALQKLCKGFLAKACYTGLYGLKYL